MGETKAYRKCSCGEKIDIHSWRMIQAHKERGHTVPIKRYRDPPKVWIGNRLVGLI